MGDWYSQHIVRRMNYARLAYEWGHGKTAFSEMAEICVDYFGHIDRKAEQRGKTTAAQNKAAGVKAANTSKAKCATETTDEEGGVGRYDWAKGSHKFIG